MLLNVRLYRRHSDPCNRKYVPHLREDVLDQCDCNLGYKGTDPATRVFRRLMFAPPIKEERAAWRALDDMERGQMPVVIAAKSKSFVRLSIREAFEKYYKLAEQRNVKESSIYSMSRVVGNAMVRLADSRGVKYVDELGENFGPDLMSSFQVTVNTRSDYRRWLLDFCRIATLHQWTSIDLAARIEIPARGKGRTPPPNPTEPFDLKSELPKIMEAIPTLTLGAVTRKPSAWRTNVETAKAFVMLLRYTGLRISDALLFEPKSLEKRTVRDADGRDHNVYVRWIRKQKKTDTPVFVIMPLEVGEFIKSAPRLSEQYAFCPPGKSTGVPFRSWLNNTPNIVLHSLESASGVKHIHAHRFRDTFALELYRKTKDWPYVSRALGHSSVVVTMNHYAHFLQEDQDDAIRKMLEGWQSSSEVPRVFPTLQTPDQSLNR